MARSVPLLAAPHRLPFLAGTTGFAATAGWWLAWLAGQAGFMLPLPESTLPAALLHAPALIYFGFAPFVFGFLLTVFPRWMGYPDLPRGQFGPIALLLAAAVLAGAAGLWTAQPGLVSTGLALLALGWAIALGVLGRLLGQSRRDRKPPCWHAYSAWIALLLGLIGVGLVLVFVARSDGEAWRWSHQLGTGGFLLPVFLTVAHRMVPFFAGNVVAGYQRWKPDWVMAALWLALLVRLGGELAQAMPTVVAGCAGLAGLTALMAWKWWPRSPGPGLLSVLIWGFAWAPLGFALAALAAAGVPLGLAPVHALMVGFSGSLLVAMVTRVTQGHSGRPLAMGPLAWLAFAAVQLAALTRIATALRGEGWMLLTLAALILIAGMLPWLARNAVIYLAPRRDGKPG